MNGLLLIDKPVGLTSMDVIRRVRRALGTRKVGHTGTLDPLATGLLPVTVGSCTKLAKYLNLEPKIYTFEVVFGELTETADNDGAVVERGRTDVTASEVEAALPQFTGAIMQRPPRYSAIRVDGKHAYELARAGVDFELPAREIQVDALQLNGIEDGVAQMEVTCGTGTYVRSIAVDIAAALGTVAHARSIRRVRVGAWDVADAIALDAVDATALIAPLQMLAQLPVVQLTAAEVAAVRQGKSIRRGVDDGVVALAEHAELVAVAEARGGVLQPRRVLVDD